jgi:hypothetical protein
MKVTITVFYNMSDYSAAYGFNQQDLLEQKAQYVKFYETPEFDHLSVMRQLYAMYNGELHNFTYTGRSMSIGDVIEFNHDNGRKVVYACAMSGWTDISPILQYQPHMPEPVLIDKAPEDADFDSHQVYKMAQHVRTSLNKINLIKDIREYGRANGYRYTLRQAHQYMEVMYKRYSESK